MNTVNRLDDQIAEHFDLAELEDLCFKLDINFENVAGTTLNEKSLDLVLYCERHQKLKELLVLLAELRPNVDWPKPSEITSSPQRMLVKEPAPKPALRRAWILIPLLGLIAIAILIWQLWPASPAPSEPTAAAILPAGEAAATNAPPPTTIVSADLGSDLPTQAVEEAPAAVLEQSSFPTATPSMQLVSEERLVSSPGRSVNPAVISDLNGGLHLAWWDNTARSGAAGDIFYMYHPPDGDWGEIERLTDETLQYVSEYETSLRLRPDGAVCVFFVDAAAGMLQRCRQDGVWSPAEAVGNFFGETDPQFDSDGPPHVVHRRLAADIYFDEILLSDGLNAGSGPKLAIDSEGVYHVVWLSAANFPYRVMHRQSSDQGATWSEAEVLSEKATQPQMPFTLMADANGRVHLAWHGWEGGHFYRAWSAASGWGQPEKLSDQFSDNCTSVDLHLAANGDLIFAWQGHQGLYASTRPAGDNQTWSAPFQVSQRLCRGDGPKLAMAANGDPFLVYSDASDDEIDLYGAEVVVP